MNGWDEWEFLKLRAELAGLFVQDSGVSVEFRVRAKRELGIDMQSGIFQRETELQEAGEWLKSHNVNLPGWQE